MAGVRRTHGTARGRVSPLAVDDVRAICGAHLPDGVKGQRDRALLLTGFSAALRRSEVVALVVKQCANSVGKDSGDFKGVQPAGRTGDGGITGRRRGEGHRHAGAAQAHDRIAALHP